jgi:hypothetical protein
MNYEEKLEHFRARFETHHNERLARLYPELDSESIRVETGYKFDKVFVNRNCGGTPNTTQQIGRYMVESRTGDIYGIKSWTQVNKRRWYGTLETVDQYDWSDFYARPLAGTEAEKANHKREQEIRSKHKKRGRKPKVAGLKV